MTEFFPFVTVFIGAVFVLVSTTLLRRTWVTAHRTRTWPRTTGEVVSVNQERRTHGTGSDRRVAYVLVAHYRYRHPMNMMAIDATSDVPRRVPVGAGAQVEVAYHPEDPSRSFIPGSGNLLTTGLTTLVGLVFLAIGLGVLGVNVWLLLR